MSFFNAASIIGVTVSPPILAAVMLAVSWHGVSITIGVLRIFLAIDWYILYHNHEHVELIAVRQAYLNAGSVNVRQDPLSSAEWRSLFRNRIMWGMMLGFSGINYTAWLYLAWPLDYLRTACNLGLRNTGLMAAVPSLFGAAGILANDYATDWLVRGGMTPIKSCKVCAIAGMFCSVAFTLVIPQATISMAAALLIGMVLFCTHFAETFCWDLVYAVVASRMTAPVNSTQDFASFICAFSAPIITGFIVDTTRLFRLTLIICDCVIAVGALACIFLVCQPINDPWKD